LASLQLFFTGLEGVLLYGSVFDRSQGKEVLKSGVTWDQFFGLSSSLQEDTPPRRRLRSIKSRHVGPGPYQDPASAIGSLPHLRSGNTCGFDFAEGRSACAELQMCSRCADLRNLHFFRCARSIRVPPYTCQSLLVNPPISRPPPRHQQIPDRSLIFHQCSSLAGRRSQHGCRRAGYVSNRLFEEHPTRKMMLLMRMLSLLYGIVRLSTALLPSLPTTVVPLE
jgi:hypothetical protein